MFRRVLERIAAAFGNLSLTAKGTLVVAIPVCALLGVIVVFYQLEENTRSARGWVEHTFQVRSEVRRLRGVLTSAEDAARGYLLTRKDAYLQAYLFARSQAPGAVSALHKQMGENPAESRELAQVEALLAKALDSLEQVRHAAGNRADSGIERMEAAQRAMQELRNSIGVMENQEQRFLVERTDHERQSERRFGIAIVAAGGVGLLGGVLAALLFTASIARRIQGLETEARQGAAGVPMPGNVTGNDEIGRLARTLKETSHRLSAQAEQLRSAQTELESRVEQRTAELRVANEELRQSNQVKQALMRSSPLAIGALDLEGNITFWNPAAEKIFGWNESEVIGKPLPVIPENQREEFREWLERFRQGDALNGIERSRLKKDGSVLEVSIWTAPLTDARGAISGTILIDSDVTQRKILEEQFRQSQKLEAVGRLAGGVAHDFNNLLTVILGYLTMLIAEAENSPEIMEYAQEIQDAASRASALTGQLLAFSRRQISQPKVVDLNAVATDSIRMLRRLIGEDIEVATQFDPLLGRIKADPIHIDQVIMNLVVNARDAMVEGGKLTVHTANVVLDENNTDRELGVKPGYYAMLAVSDTGTGMTPEVRSRLFEPFFTTKEPGKGTGLGLSIVYGVVKQNHGEIMVSAEPGLGTTFRIYFPIAEIPAELAAPEVEPAAGRGNEAVLLCEDERHIRKLVFTLLSKQGYHVLEAETPDEAIRVAREFNGRIDLLLSDVVMPRISGFDLAKIVTEKRPDIKVLYMSGYTDNKGTQSRVIDANTPFLHKPFTAAALTRKVREALGG